MLESPGAIPGALLCYQVYAKRFDDTFLVAGRMSKSSGTLF